MRKARRSSCLKGPAKRVPWAFDSARKSPRSWDRGLFVECQGVALHRSGRVGGGLGDGLFFGLLGGVGLEGFEVEVLVAVLLGLDGDADRVLALERAAEDFLGEGVFHVLFDGAAEGAGAEVGVG